MSECVCNSEQKYRAKYAKTRKKYENLRRHHKKLLSVSIELTQVLEEYVRGQRSPNVTETLVLCSKIYPSLFNELSSRTKDLSLEDGNKAQWKRSKEELPHNKSEEKIETAKEVENNEVNEENNKNGEDPADKEYFEGFWSRPKLPRTPTTVSK